MADKTAPPPLIRVCTHVHTAVQTSLCSRSTNRILKCWEMWGVINDNNLSARQYLEAYQALMEERRKKMMGEFPYERLSPAGHLPVL